MFRFMPFPTKLTGTTTRFGKYEKNKLPNEIYPKRKEIHVDNLIWTNQWNNPQFLEEFNTRVNSYQKSGMEFYSAIRNPTIIQNSLN